MSEEAAAPKEVEETTATEDTPKAEEEVKTEETPKSEETPAATEEASAVSLKIGSKVIKMCSSATLLGCSCCVWFVWVSPGRSTLGECQQFLPYGASWFEPGMYPLSLPSVSITLLTGAFGIWCIKTQVLCP